ncbi:hypothetical protein TREMEDRAFT_65078 [Tremella mesenterica DSM 1558]|uniref:uncharacterized protein n=1 Tax=Tremella mesenterica (strain ATCC 24925 / CBS 8224 / DSM 1558 / NBRC 9311 / NRRL Y-6157 / RJB 2259-6 / UBC 559-6) TaxID=578456 RepID=UPI00032C0E6A|nr:uncharacterized protein TREMEDRAFT_65078 [Tremella mesenterica DSM 1558]EIW66686.1 hypothetical protein TREMEDRAFT_65078 [Tremella mesenterica DSM 1558]
MCGASSSSPDYIQSPTSTLVDDTALKRFNGGPESTNRHFRTTIKYGNWDTQVNMIVSARTFLTSKECQRSVLLSICPAGNHSRESTHVSGSTDHDGRHSSYAGSMRAIGKHARKLWMWARQQAEVPSKHHYIEFTTVLPTNASEAQRREAIMKHGVYNLATQLTSFSNALVGTEEGRLHKGLGGMGRSALNFLFSRT